MIGVTARVDTYDAEVSVETLYWAVDKIRKGALTDQVLEAAYEHMDKRFMAHMIAAAESRRNLRHVFDWPNDGAEGLGAPLFKTIMGGKGSKRVVSYVFLESRNYVPIREELQPYNLKRHIFHEKARIFETGESVIIERKPETKWLVYINEHRNAGFTERGGFVDDQGTTFSKGPSYIERTGGHKFKNNFANEFFIWWTSEAGGGTSLEYLANNLTRQVSVQTARFASAKRRVASLRGAMNRKNATPEAKRRAEQAINAIKMQWRKDRRDRL